MQISTSRLRAYSLCPQKYYFRYIEEIDAEFLSGNLFFGSAMHHAISEYHQSRNKIGSNGMYREFLKYWNAVIADCEGKDHPIRYTVNPQQFLDKAYKLCVEYVGQFKEIVPQSSLDVELLFECPLFDPVGGWGSLSHTLTGKIDLVVNNSIYEFKTASRTPSQSEADSSIQLTAYALAYQYLYGEPAEHLYLVALVKTQKPKVHLLETKRWFKDYQDLVDMGMGIARSIEGGIFYRNRETLYGCGTCEYQTRCLGFRPTS